MTDAEMNDIQETKILNRIFMFSMIILIAAALASFFVVTLRETMAHSQHSRCVSSFTDGTSRLDTVLICNEKVGYIYPGEVMENGEIVYDNGKAL